MTIHLYAEHLLNIRMLSIQASLSTVSNKETRSTLSADGKTLTLEHEGQEARIQFPAKLLSGKNRATFVIPAAPTKELTFRLRIDEKPSTTNVLGDGIVDNEAITPWTATTLSQDAQISCRSCDGVLVSRSMIKQWKDLPSVGWAEMMEFWHCHKPDVPQEHHDHGELKKGYAANSQLALECGTCLVDPIEFLFAADDCLNVESSQDENNNIVCSKCKTNIGTRDIATQGLRLRKPYLAVSTPQDEHATAYPTEKWLSCFLLNATESQGVRKFTISTRPASTTALKIWVFTPDLNVSSSASHERDQPVRVSKILWEDCPTPAVEPESMNSQNLSEAEIELPKAELDALRERLEASAAWLPESARTFQEWRIGLLQRFARSDIKKACTKLSRPSQSTG